MVDNSGGQLYTIEGLAAAVIMLVTAWIVLNTTTLYTPGDTHITDMQLEQLGTDVLAMMDAPNNSIEHRKHMSDLREFIKNNYSTVNPGLGPSNFSAMFIAYCDKTTGGRLDSIQYNASVYYRDETDGLTKSYFFSKSRDLTPGDHAVRVSKWVFVDNQDGSSQTPSDEDILDHRPQEVLLEVLLWRG